MLYEDELSFLHLEKKTARVCINPADLGNRFDSIKIYPHQIIKSVKGGYLWKNKH